MRELLPHIRLSFVLSRSRATIYFIILLYSIKNVNVSTEFFLTFYKLFANSHEIFVVLRNIFRFGVLVIAIDAVFRPNAICFKPVRILEF